MKTPCFKFYTQDWLIGTHEMTNEEVGQYIRIICWLHQKGRMKENKIVNYVGEILPKVSEKFRKDSGEFWYNERLELEVDKYSNYCKSRQLNRTSKSDMSEKTYVKHMEIEIETNKVDTKVGTKVGTKVSANSSRKTERFKKPTELEVQTYFQTKIPDQETAIEEATKFFNYYDDRNWKDLKRWKGAASNWVINMKRYETTKTKQTNSKQAFTNLIARNKGNSKLFGS